MAKKKTSPELEEAILNLPQKEKNKLLIRLINKDQLLTDQLQYRLLENTESDLEFRRAEIKEQIAHLLKHSPVSLYKDLLYYVREGVSSINRHSKVTKDKRGELGLLVYLFQEAEGLLPGLKNQWRDRLFKEKFIAYGLARTDKMNTLLNTLHEDFRLEFEEDIAAIHTWIIHL